MIKLINFHKQFGELKVIKGIDLTIDKGEIISIIGSSGSGKSTLLRMINCIESADKGHLSLNDETYNLEYVKEKDKRKIRKQASMVFQNYNLFKHKTALENVMEGLLINGMSKKNAITSAIDLLKRVGLSDKLNSYPSQLSGGQQQRVGIARAMALKPKVLLLDEPTSALDPELVGEVLEVIKSLAGEDITMIIVTHEMDFAKLISNRVIFLEEGKVAADGSPEEIFSNVTNERLKNFIGKHHIS